MMNDEFFDDRFKSIIHKHLYCPPLLNFVKKFGFWLKPLIYMCIAMRATKTALNAKNVVDDWLKIAFEQWISTIEGASL